MLNKDILNKYKYIFKIIFILSFYICLNLKYLPTPLSLCEIGHLWLGLYSLTLDKSIICCLCTQSEANNRCQSKVVWLHKHLHIDFLFSRVFNNRKFWEEKWVSQVVISLCCSGIHKILNQHHLLPCCSQCWSNLNWWKGLWL